MSAEETFRAKAPGIMRDLMVDFAITKEDAAAIVGNLGHESAGFTKLQEEKPTVQGSRGGYGWAQWTGPRRRAFEAYCDRNKLNPASDAANYKFLWNELKGNIGTEGAALGKVAAASGVEAKTKAFELAFLRAGIKHYPSRIKYAQWALEAFNAAPSAKPPTAPASAPTGLSGVLATILRFIIDLFKGRKA